MIPACSAGFFAALALAGCDGPFADLQACRGDTTDIRINERGDQDELTGHPLAGAALSNGRVLIAFAAQTRDEATREVVTSEVRMAMVNPATGGPYTVCATTRYDLTLTDVGAFAFGASATPVDLTIENKHAVALVAWTEGREVPGAVVKMRFVDGAGCPLGITFLPYAGSAFASSVAWSETQHAVLVTLQDQRDVHRVWVNSVGPGDSAIVAAGQGVIEGFPVAAVASDGSAMVVWAESGRGGRGVLLDPAGNPRAVTESTGADATFAVDFPLIAETSNVLFSMAVAAADRFAVAMEQRTITGTVPARVMAREYSLDGVARGPGYLLDADDAQAQFAATLRYAPGGTLLAVWEARGARGTVGRVLGPDGTTRFNTVSCDDGRFDIGMRAETVFGYPSIVIADGEVLVLHSAPGGDDPQGSAARMWMRPYAELWPGPQ